MENVIIIAILVAIIGSAGFYVYKAKKNGRKCIGCPNSCGCSGQNGQGCSGCSGGCCK
jgi:hypothetical protein